MSRLGRSVLRLATTRWNRYYLVSRGVVVGQGVVVTGRLRTSLSPESTVRIGNDVVLNSEWSRNTLTTAGANSIKTFRSGAVISIGEGSGITSVSISAGKSVRIGRRVLIGAGCIITDSDHHVVRLDDVSLRRGLGLPPVEADSEVRIDDDVFIGARSILLKGVTIGRGSVIGAGSVVTASIPPFSIAAGNPCVVVGSVTN